MLIYAVACLGFAALGGLILAATILKGRLAPWPISLLHAVLGASGLVLLLISAVNGVGGSQIVAALGLLVVAALGGFYLASFHMRKRIAPKGLILVHAAIAVIGFLTLLSIVLKA